MEIISLNSGKLYILNGNYKSLNGNYIFKYWKLYLKWKLYL